MLNKANEKAALVNIFESPSGGINVPIINAERVHPTLKIITVKIVLKTAL